MGAVKFEQLELDLGIKSYMIEVTTNLPVTVNENDVTKESSLFDLITSKAGQVIESLDMNTRPFTLKITSESKDNE